MLVPTGQTEAFFENDPVKAAEEEIRAYLLQHRIAQRARIRPGNGGLILCLLGIYATLALIVAGTLFCVNRIQCDPLFTDRGLSAACRDWSGNLERIAGPDAGSVSFGPAGSL